MNLATDETANPPHPAATILLVRRENGAASVLMGQRGAAAVFMPSKYVFPGGRADQTDCAVTLAQGLGAVCLSRLDQHSTKDDPQCSGQTLAAAAVRELWEETGLILGDKGAWTHPAPQAWQGYEELGYRPSADALRFFFRAITPPGRSRRFDARFFVADAAKLIGDPDDFSRASDELSHLHWVPLPEARHLNLPFITEVVLAELAALISDLDDHSPLPLPESVPFFDNSGPVPTFRRLI